MDHTMALESQQAYNCVLQASINPSPYRLRQLIDASPTPFTHSGLNLLACFLALDTSETTHYLIQTVKGAISANCYKKSLLQEASNFYEHNYSASILAFPRDPSTHSKA